MKGEVALDVALCCSANAFLNGSMEREEAARLLENNGAIRFCEFVHFVTLSHKWFFFGDEQRVAADSPSDWLLWLQRNRCGGLIMSYHPNTINPHFPDHKLSGFINAGGTWILEARMPMNMGEAWAHHWELGDKGHTQSRIWRVTYARMKQDFIWKPRKLMLEQMSSRLEKALNDIEQFARVQKLDEWTPSFQGALAALRGEAVSSEGFPLSLPAQKVLDAVQQAWVFGGMGSWNDLSFDGSVQTQYERVSSELYDALTHSICEATNSSFEPIN